MGDVVEVVVVQVGVDEDVDPVVVEVEVEDVDVVEALVEHPQPPKAVYKNLRVLS